MLKSLAIIAAFLGVIWAIAYFGIALPNRECREKGGNPVFLQSGMVCLAPGVVLN